MPSWVCSRQILENVWCKLLTVLNARNDHSIAIATLTVNCLVYPCPSQQILITLKVANILTFKNLDLKLNATKIVTFLFIQVTFVLFNNLRYNFTWRLSTGNLPKLTPLLQYCLFNIPFIRGVHYIMKIDGNMSRIAFPVRAGLLT